MFAAMFVAGCCSINMFLKIALVFLTLGDSGASVMSGEGKVLPCCEIMDMFANAVSNYTSCAVKEATPFRFCCRCREPYFACRRSGDLIYKNCSKDLILKEKHQIIGDMFAFVKKLWTGSNCHRKYYQSFRVVR